MPDQDVLTFGETMLRLSPPGRQRLSQAASLDVWVAGSESNVAAALRVLGRVRLLGEPPAGQPAGPKVEALCGHPAWMFPTSSGRRRMSAWALFYAEPAAEPRAATVVYDRANSAASHCRPPICRTRCSTRTGTCTSAASRPPCRRPAPRPSPTPSRGLRRAGRTVSLDVNYRARLWTPEAASADLAPLLRQVDVLFCSQADAARLFGLSGDAADCASVCAQRFGVPIVAVTAGENGAVGLRRAWLPLRARRPD